jgi:hypothetical protein
MQNETTKQKRYVKPQMVAKSAPKRSYVAGCPLDTTGRIEYCVACQRTR